jgi:hypothetical protein
MIASCHAIHIQKQSVFLIRPAPEARGEALKTFLVPTPSEGGGAQGGSKAPRPSRGGSGATRSPPFAGEHGEHPPFDAPEHRGISAAAISGKLWYNTAMSDPADAAADAEIEAGQCVSNDKVIEWLKSWGAPNELPCPP